MKISYLHIRNYKQFSDLELDLTYPKGHEKAGQPLDKICIIGQSGTGKTNLLDIIKKSTVDFSEQSTHSYLPFSEFVGKDTDDRYITTEFKLKKKYQAETLFTDRKSKIIFKSKQNKMSKYKIFEYEKNYFVSADRCSIEDTHQEIINYKFDINKMSHEDKRIYDKLINAKIELVLESINEKKLSPVEEAMERMAYASISRKKTTREKQRELENAICKLEDKYTTMSETIDRLKKENFIDRFIVNINEVDNSWKLLKARIENYENEKKQYENQLFKEVRKNPKNAEKTVEAMEQWEKENENILEKMADDINSVIKKFNLELQINEDTQSYEELKIKDLSNNTIIEYDDLSTGTKNLLSTFIPLKSYKPQDSIILIDEPEMSFYPDIQLQLIDLYTTVGKNNQLVVATHSPLIASSFEPWEVVELKFDKDNQIYREKYYQGDNHIDNYTIDPRMLTWTGILTDVFDLKEDSNFTVREQGLMEYATLKSEIKQMKSQKEKEKAFEKLKRVSKILGIYN